MKRVKFCSVIIIILIIFSAFSLWLIDCNCYEITTKVTEIQELCEKKETTLALEKIDELNRSWKKCYKILSLLVKHDKLSEINSIISRLQPFIENDNDELYAEFGNLLYQLKLLQQTEFPYIYNIL